MTLLRLSVRDSEMPLNSECNHAGGCKQICRHLKEFFSSKKLLSPNTILNPHTYEDDTSPIVIAPHSYARTVYKGQ